MRILFISRCPPYPLHLGDRLILYHLARELAAQGHTLDLLAYNDRPDLPDEREAYASFFGSIQIFPAPTRPIASMLRRVVMPSARFPNAAQQSWSPDMWQAIKSKITANRYDVVHLFGGIHVYEFAHLLRDLPTLITPYESYSLYLQREAQAGAAAKSSFMQRRAAQAYERFMFTPYRRVVVLSEQDRAALLALNPALQVDVIPNGIDLSRFPPPDERAPRTQQVIFTGNYEYPPNQDAALLLAAEILPKIRAKLPDARLALVGNAPTPEMQALADGHIQVIGRVPDVGASLRDAQVFACPLRYGAGIKNKVLEAMASGCAVAATPLSMEGIDAVDGTHALIREIEQLPDAITLLLTDHALRGKIAVHARALIEARYTWEQVAKAYQKLYETVTISI